jgi:haloalkane dehalogenase
MIPAEETFNGTWPFTPHFSEASGFRQHYVDEGSRDAQVLVCLHGEPTWGYLYRNFIPRLSKQYRVIVPDHMGFGKSETPQDRVYTLQTHVENLERFIDDIKLNDITFVCQDWGGPITGAYTIRHPERVKRVALMIRYLATAVACERHIKRVGLIGLRDMSGPVHCKVS